MLELALAGLVLVTSGPRANHLPCEPWPSCARPTLEAALVPPALPLSPSLELLVPADADQQQLFEYSDQYMAQLTMHRIASYATLPLFAAQFVAGQVLLADRESPPEWARAMHGPAAGMLAGLFLLNTVTGTLNLIEALPDPEGRTRRTIHGALMLLADAGFVYTGITARQAGRYIENTNTVRVKHRNVAVLSMGIATIGYLMMLRPFRGD